jgi:hypothetical protein
MSFLILPLNDSPCNLLVVSVLTRRVQRANPVGRSMTTFPDDPKGSFFEPFGSTPVPHGGLS